MSVVDRPRVLIGVDAHPDSGCVVATARLVYPQPEDWTTGDGFRYYTSYDGTGHPEYEDLVVHGQTQLDPTDSLGDRWYGYERPEYQTHDRVRLERAEVMARCLRRLERRLEALRAQLGYPSTLADQIARWGSVLGVRDYGEYQHRERADGSHYYWTDASGVAPLLASRLLEARERNGFAASA